MYRMLCELGLTIADILRDYGKELERLIQKLFKEEYLSNGLKETVGLKLETN